MKEYLKIFAFSPVLFLSLFALAQDQRQLEGSTFIDVKLRQGTNMAIALSPDKRSFAIDLQGTIWILPSTGGDAVPITDDLGDSHEPVWSPDGEYIAFQSYRTGDYDIWTVKKDGSDLKQITSGMDDDREASWSPDGNTIVFSSDRNGKYDIWAVDLATLQTKPLTTGSSNDYNPAISPDGKKISFVSEGEDPGIYMLEKGELTLVVSSALKIASPSWSETSEQLLYVSYERGKSKLWLASIKDNTSRLITGDEDVFPFRAAWLGKNSFYYTANGKIQKRTIGEDKVEFIPFEATVTLNRSKYKRKKYEFDDNEAHSPLGILGPAISPDGNSVAFTALGDIYVQEIGGEIAQITNDTFVNLDPDWSPDGKLLAFVSDRNGNMNIWLHNVVSGITKVLTTQQEWSASKPTWSPDGKTLAFYSKTHLNDWGSAVLKTLELSTGKIEAMEYPIFVPSKPTWSPDGKTIALMTLQKKSSRFREGNNVFMFVEPGSWESREISPDSTHTPGMRTSSGPVWSPNGDKMAYIQNGVLMVVPVGSNGNNTGVPKQLTIELAESPTWSGDGKYLSYIATDRLKRMTLENGKTEVIPIDLNWKPNIPEEHYIIHAGRVFNGIDSTYLENMDIFIEGQRIRAITPHQDHLDKKVIDATDKVVMPGLFEGHSHQNSSAGRKLGSVWLSYGITSVREPGADPYDALERKESWAAGIRPGPRLFSTGGLIGGSRVFYGLANSVTKDAHIKMEMNRARKLGYDMIKTYVRTSDLVQKQIITAAHEIGIPVSSHEIYPAAKYNIDAVEHFRGTSRRGYSPKQTALNFIYDDVIQVIVKSGMTVTPTIVMHEGFLKVVKENPEVLDNKQLKAFYSKNYIDSWANREAREDYGPNFQEFQKAVTTIFHAGGNIMAGTDSPFVPFGASLHAELWLFVDGGLSPFQALQTATINAAKAIGVEKDLGSVERGKLADLVILDGDPLENIKDSWNVETVIKGGVIYGLNELLLHN